MTVEPTQCRPARSLLPTLVSVVKCCLMSSDVSWHIRDKLWPMPKHGPRKPEGSLGRTAQDVHLDSHTAPELWPWSLSDEGFLSKTIFFTFFCFTGLHLPLLSLYFSELWYISYWRVLYRIIISHIGVYFSELEYLTFACHCQLTPLSRCWLWSVFVLAGNGVHLVSSREGRQAFSKVSLTEISFSMPWQSVLSHQTEWWSNISTGRWHCWRVLSTFHTDTVAYCTGAELAFQH